MAVRRQNMSIDPTVFEEFCNYAGKKGIKISTWVTIKMKEFVEEEKFLEEMRKNKN
ncbi:hypothetical protein [Clostridium lacusfryxellense]|uniref:hypothetical protein n=1 Tax=Clostridium lacusfryxellense TaxID=205328 RepID=UPI001C0C797B|nr:hypothetical protein [Clostridium lacusfryxellense]MBU3112012.1 hypothetical protein [Clostridium lacusfryxellense]